MSTDTEVAVEAAEAGAVVVRELYGAPTTRTPKRGRDFSTDADRAAEQAIMAHLRAARPGDALLGEESGRTGPPHRRRTWLVDPICGTLNFAARTPLVAVNVALLEGEDVVAAAVVDPMSEVTLRSDRPSTPSPASRLVDIDFDADPAWAAGIVGAPTFGDSFGVRVSSTTLALAWVAEGRRAAYLHKTADHRGVHVAAGIALCRTAGCVVTTLADGNGLVVTADRATYDALLPFL